MSHEIAKWCFFHQDKRESRINVRFYHALSQSSWPNNWIIISFTLEKGRRSFIQRETRNSEKLLTIIYLQHLPKSFQNCFGSNVSCTTTDRSNIQFSQVPNFRSYRPRSNKSVPRISWHQPFLRQWSEALWWLTQTVGVMSHDLIQV